MLKCDFAKCKTKEDVIRCYLSHLCALEKIANQNYAIETTEFREYLHLEFGNKISDDALQRVNQQQPVQCNATAISNPVTKFEKSNSLTKFRQTSGDYFKKYLVQNVCANLKRYFISAFIISMAIILVNYKLEASNLFMRNIQSLIYPGMRAWRKLTLPIILTFPQLTELYDETCLVANPLFQVAEMDCSPCANVFNVLDLSTSGHLTYFDHSVPHIIEQTDTNAASITIASLYSLYRKNHQIFLADAFKVQSTNNKIHNLDQLFDVLFNQTGKFEESRHHLWRINRMAPARILRTMFAVPDRDILPLHAGIGVERYIAIDTGGGSGDIAYQLPTTDCSNMFVYQAMGSRTIHLQPTNECKQQCRRLSIRLKPNYTLFYDWWYWKPISTGGDQFSKTTTISYIGSYC